MNHPNLIIIHDYATRPEADLAVTALDSVGIPAMIQADTAGGMREHLAWSGKGFRILVREDDAPAAREILAPISEPLADQPDASSDDTAGTQHKDPTGHRLT